MSAYPYNILLAEAREDAERWRNLAAVIAVCHIKKDELTTEQIAVIEEQLERLTPELLTLPWEDKLFSFEEVLK